MATLEEDWELVHHEDWKPRPIGGGRQIVPRPNAAARDAASRIAFFVARMPITYQLASLDLDRLRVNVTHLVAPELVKWRE